MSRKKNIPQNRFDKKSTMSVPAEFDADIVLTANLRKDSHQKMKDTLHFILNSIISLQDQKKYQDFDIYDGYVPVNATILNKICGGRYKDGLTLLKQHGIIESDKKYEVGKKSYGFRLSDKYAASELTYRELVDKDIRKKYINHRQENDTKNQEALDKISFITKFFNKENLTVDIESSHSYVEFYRKHMKGFLKDEPKYTADERKVILNRINQRANNIINSVKKIASGDFQLSRTGKDNRLHSPISSIKKEFRSFIKYRGEGIVSIDIKSSQPYLLTQLLKPEFYKKRKNVINLETIYSELYKHISIYPETHSIIMFGVKAQVPVNQLFKNGFFDVNWDEDFYKILMDSEVTEAPGSPAFVSREITKKLVMLILYYKDNGLKNGGRTFKKLFPKEHKVIEAFNAIEGESYLPILLQRLESHLVLDEVCKEVSNQLPNAPILPVHDCIYTTGEYKSQVRDIMEKILLELTGVKPGLKVEIKTSEQALKELESVAKADFDKIKADLIINKRKNKYNPTEKKVGLKKPLLAKIPNVNGKKSISTRYVDENAPDIDEELT